MLCHCSSAGSHTDHYHEDLIKTGVLELKWLVCFYLYCGINTCLVETILNQSTIIL